MRNKVIIVLMVAIIFAPVFSAAGDLIIIGNPAIEDSILSKKDIGKVFLGKKKSWKNRSKIVIVLQKDPAIHKAFLKQYVFKTTAQFNDSWKRLIFSGKRSSPQILDGNRKVIEYISRTKGAIGYVSSDSDLKNVKTISVK